MAFQNIRWLSLVILIGLYTLPLSARAVSSVTLAEWTFPNNPDDAVADGGTPENITHTLSLIGASTPTYTTTGATTFSARATGWQGGQFQKYWQLEVDTRDYHNLTLSAKQRSSATGPRDFVVEYRLDANDTWTPVPGGVVTLADNFTSGVLDALSLPSDTANQEHLLLRFVMATNTSVSGSAVTSTGASRIDDIVLNAELINEPEDDSPTTTCSTASALVSFNEIFPYAPTADAEYVELANQDANCIDLSGWRIEDQNSHKYIIPGGTLAAPGQLLVFFRNFYMNNTSEETLYLYNAANEVVDQLSYDQAIKDFSYSFDGSLFRFTSLITPGTLNTFDTEVPEEEPETEATSNQVTINELLPNPKGNEVAGEYIELFNNAPAAINLNGWSLADTSRSKFVFREDTPLEPQTYLVLPRSLFKFSLNNTGSDTVSLLDPHGQTISSVTYTNPKEDLSYSRKEDAWLFTRHLTPGEENRFSKEPKITLKSKRDGFVKKPLTFKADLKRKMGHHKLSYRWDFGDGHGSNLAEPRHAYQKKGTYRVTVRIKNTQFDAEKTFTVRIKNYPTIPVIITALKPNPTGKDTGNEWIELENTSEKVVDLKNWKIATGEDKESLTNHSILDTFTLKPQEIRRLNRGESAFTLNNKKSVIELRSPDDETVSSASYDEEKIEEDAVCRNIKEVCDFPGEPQQKEDSEKDPLPQETESLKETSPSLPEEVLGDSTESLTETSKPLDTKKDLARRIRQDLNTLLNLYIQDLVGE